MFPFPSFASFLFRREEHALWLTDVGWSPNPTFQIQGPLGSGVDVVSFMRPGSDSREFEIVFTPDRFDLFAALIGTVGDFVDWARPVPDQRSAILLLCDPLEDLIALNRQTGRTERKRRTKVQLLSQ